MRPSLCILDQDSIRLFSCLPTNRDLRIPLTYLLPSGGETLTIDTAKTHRPPPSHGLPDLPKCLWGDIVCIDEECNVGLARLFLVQGLPSLWLLLRFLRPGDTSALGERD